MITDKTALAELQRQKLRVLATGLRFLASNPHPSVGFNMAEFFNGGEYFAARDTWVGIEDVTELPCATAACALGWASHFVERKRPDEDWDVYEVRVFGLDFASKESLWMFGGGWCTTDNTPAGAAARIEWFLEKGVPENHYSQRNGRHPLCYVTNTIAIT